jgi:hypothetical protein
MDSLWQTVRAYFLPSAHPDLRPVREGGGQEFRPKLDEFGQRVEAGERENVWDCHRADRARAHNRAVVRPYMGAYIRRWLVLAALLWLASKGMELAGAAFLSWPLSLAAALALVTAFLLVLLRQEVRR